MMTRREGGAGGAVAPDGAPATGDAADAIAGSDADEAIAFANGFVNHLATAALVDGRRADWCGEDFRLVGCVLAQVPAPKEDPPPSLAREYARLREVLLARAT
ncbi:MAG: hypothetical protein HY763_03655 [Planctomycetes bacterium]|nr:hypothetical protein [Planctomycetota bacterium]